MSNSTTNAATTRATALEASRKTPPDCVPGSAPAIPGAAWRCCARFCGFRNGPKWDYCVLCRHNFCEDCAIISGEGSGGPPRGKGGEGGDGKGGVNGGAAAAVNGATTAAA